MAYTLCGGLVALLLGVSAAEVAASDASRASLAVSVTVVRSCAVRGSTASAGAAVAIDCGSSSGTATAPRVEVVPWTMLTVSLPSRGRDAAAGNRVQSGPDAVVDRDSARVLVINF